MNQLNQLNWQRDNFENIETAWDGDLWDRERLGIQLTNYVDRLQCGAVLALDARWGEGKTWFVRHWMKHLENPENQHNVIYLDAFGNDYLEDPFLVITSEITNILKQNKKTESGVKRLLDLSGSVGTTLLPSLPKIALTLGLHLVGAGFLTGVLQQGYEGAKDGIDALSNEVSDRIKESIQEKIAGHEAEKETLKDFKSHLAKMVEELDKPLVFIIDELDRCRPDFSIRLIERIKHFFDIKNIVFVLVMDKAQFSKTVCHNYGYDEKLGEEYLDKFIDFSLRLNPKRKEITSIFISEKLKDLGVKTTIAHFKGVDRLFLFMVNNCNTSSRELIKLIHTFNLLAFNDQTKNYILILMLFLRRDIAHKRSSLEIWNFISEWFVEIIDNDADLREQLEYKKEELSSRGKLYKPMEPYGLVIKSEHEITIHLTFIRTCDEIQENPSHLFTINEMRYSPFNSYKGSEELDFKKAWDFYLSSGLSISSD